MRYLPFKIILPPQAGFNKSSPKVQCSVGEGPLDPQTLGPPVVSCCAAFNDVVSLKKPPTSVICNDQHLFLLRTLFKLAEQFC